jgi:hypothetical protein
VFTGADASAATCITLQDGAYFIGFNYTSIAVPASGGSVILSMIDSDAAARVPSFASSDVLDAAFGGNAAVASMQMPVLTTGVAVTKAADDPFAAIGSWYSQGLGTIYCDYVIPPTAASQFPTLASIDDGTGNNRVQMFTQTDATGSTLGMRVDVAGVAEVNTGGVAFLTFPTRVKGVFAFTTNNSRIVQNGGTVTSDTVCAMPTGLTTLRVGKSVPATTLIRTIRELRYYPSASASDAQLQAITT